MKSAVNCLPLLHLLERYLNFRHFTL